jgi:hypothetical protein
MTETTTNTTSKSASPLEAIPDPQVIRARLGECLRETAMLRSLLRVAERAAKGRRQTKAVDDAQ